MTLNIGLPYTFEKIDTTCCGVKIYVGWLPATEACLTGVLLGAEAATACVSKAWAAAESPS